MKCSDLCNRNGEVPEWVEHSGAEATEGAGHGAFQLSDKQIWRREPDRNGHIQHVNEDKVILKPIIVRPLPTTLLSSLSKYIFHIRRPFSSSLWMKPHSNQTRNTAAVSSESLSLNGNYYNNTVNSWAKNMMYIPAVETHFINTLFNHFLAASCQISAGIAPPLLHHKRGNHQGQFEL